MKKFLMQPIRFEKTGLRIIIEAIIETLIILAIGIYLLSPSMVDTLSEIYANAEANGSTWYTGWLLTAPVLIIVSIILALLVIVARKPKEDKKKRH